MSEGLLVKSQKEKRDFVEPEKIDVVGLRRYYEMTEEERAEALRK